MEIKAVLSVLLDALVNHILSDMATPRGDAQGDSTCLEVSAQSCTCPGCDPRQDFTELPDEVVKLW